VASSMCVITVYKVWYQVDKHNYICSRASFLPIWWSGSALLFWCARF